MPTAASWLRSNDDIARSLEEFGGLLQLTGQNPFRARAYLAAAASIRELPAPVADLIACSELRRVPGVGPPIAEAIEEIVRRGSFASLDDLKERYPATLLDLLRLPGVGPKTVLRLFTELGIADLDRLEIALNDGSLRSAKGFGARFETLVERGLRETRARAGSVPLGLARPAAIAFAAERRGHWAGRVEPVGGVRRFEETVPTIELLVEADDPALARSRIETMTSVASAVGASDDALRVRLQNGQTVWLHFSPTNRFGLALTLRTGPTAHVERMGPLPQVASDEVDVYSACGMPWIPPELRSDGSEFDRCDEIPSLVTQDDVAGELHCHSVWSDGGATIAEMAAAAEARGYAYLAITDHSRSLAIANGLDTDRLAAQRRELAGTAVGLALLQGSEVEVARDGRLDFADETLAWLDVVVASLHVGLRQERDELTRRLLGAIANPHVDIIAHPSGRLIGRRPGGDFDWDRVFAEAARSGTALEINADPARLDLNAELTARAAAAGCLLTINCDAHAPSGFNLLAYGVAVARKAWVPRDRIVNTWSRERLTSWLHGRGR